MARRAGATREEVEAILNKYRQSGLTRQEYCRREGLTTYALDYYQRRLYKLREREAAEARKSVKVDGPPARIARVDVRGATPLGVGDCAGFAMTLANGRRIEVNGWGFRDSDLARLIQVAERA